LFLIIVTERVHKQWWFKSFQGAIKDKSVGPIYSWYQIDNVDRVLQQFTHKIFLKQNLKYRQHFRT